MSLLRTLALLLTAGALLDGAIAADAPGSSPASPPAKAMTSRAVMTGEQVVRILDETVDWYRTLGAQQQSATQPSDLLILYANRQIADRAIALAFEIARANAELLSSEADVAQKTAADAASSPQALQRVQQQLDGRRAEIQAEIASTQRRLAAAPKAESAEVQTRISELQSELDLVNARRNLHGSMSQFTYQSDANGAGVNALKAHIDAIAVSIPSSSGGAGPMGAAAGSASVSAAAPTASSPLSSGGDHGSERLGAAHRVLHLVPVPLHLVLPPRVPWRSEAILRRSPSAVKARRRALDTSRLPMLPVLSRQLDRWRRMRRP